MFERLLENPAVKRARAAGEARMGKVMAAILSNEKVMAGVQKAMMSALGARAALEQGLKSALRAANLPSTEELAELRKRVKEVETALDGLAAKVDAPAKGKRAAAPRDGHGGETSTGGGPAGQ